MERFHPIPRASARAELGLEPHAPCLLFPADPARPGKRYDRAVALARDVPLHTLGGVAPEEVPLWVNAANAVVVPSEAEGFGLAALEALACDVPVLATPVGVHRQAMEGVAGALCAPFDVERWRAAVTPHLDDPDPRIAGRAHAEPVLRDADGRAPRGRVERAAQARLRVSQEPMSSRSSEVPRETGNPRGRMEWSMNAQTTSPSDQPAVDPEPRTQTEELAKPTEPSGVQTSPGGAATGSAEPPAGMEMPPPQPRSPGFRERGRMRRRVRFVRKARELAYRDLGGLVFEMQRLGQRNDELVAAKLGVLATFDTELRALEKALGERHPVTVLREAGIGACPRCAAIHGSEDRFCPMCGMPMGRPAESPIAGAPMVAAGTPPPLAAASVAAASSVTPGQLPAERRRRARLRRPNGPTPPASPPAPTPSASPPVLVPPQRSPTGHRFTRPTPPAETPTRGPPHGDHPPAGRVGVSVATPPPPGSAPQEPVEERCPLCGGPLGAEQEWCLRCGAAARTRLAATPRWRPPVIALTTVIVLSLGALTAALVSLAGSSGTGGTVAVTRTVTTPAAGTVTTPSAAAGQPRRRAQPQPGRNHDTRRSHGSNHNTERSHGNNHDTRRSRGGDHHAGRSHDAGYTHNARRGRGDRGYHARRARGEATTVS